MLIAGDSAAAGVGVSTQQDALSGMLCEGLSAHYCVNWRLKAKTGVNSASLANMLQDTNSHTDSPLTSTSMVFDLTVISIGVNDVTGFTSLYRWRRNIVQIIELLQTSYHCQSIVFTALPPMHEFPALPQPLRWVLGQKAKYLNNALVKLVNKYQGVNVLTLSLHPQEDSSSNNTLEYMAEDGFHPHSAGYQLWANAIIKLVNEEVDGLVGKSNKVS
ncbi:SGNH/GDSL hydrolase family protein [Alteromonas sp. 1_MG-2023]|uniref:SGNH/GDSL hydrolase family protein n=1 Tax=Alteromonas sp. 1_MG-2023 TaxID=3062669 RepID=UPI0026E26043|nr:SGNH/GDSL hydrolase family protein [Alteromonas sp. 1_MG-2023]MDO6569211.1 SGNH/GDSL hydrolase family protein [Alteromonas sp. 1_MG-2023]